VLQLHVALRAGRGYRLGEDTSMTTTIRQIIGLLLIAMAPVSVLAQDNSAEMQQAVAAFDDMVQKVNEFVGDVRFDETDVSSLIGLWEEFNQFEQDEEEEDESFEFGRILGDNEYRSWAQSHDLDPDDWLRKTVRISMALYREQVLASAEEMPKYLADQLATLEEQREQLGDDVYRQIKQGMEETRRLGEAMVASARRLPEPTSAERATLDRHREELMVLIMQNEDDVESDDYYDDEGAEDFE